MISRGAVAAQAAAHVLLCALAFASPQSAPKSPMDIIAEEQAAMGFIQPKPVGRVEILRPRGVLAKKDVAGCAATAVVGSDGRVGRVRITGVSANVNLMLKDFVTWMCDVRYHPATLHGVPVPASLQKTQFIDASEGKPSPSLEPPAESRLYDCRTRSWVKETPLPPDAVRVIDVRLGGPEPALLNQTVPVKQMEARFPDAVFGPAGVDPKHRMGSVSAESQGFLGAIEVLPENGSVRLLTLRYLGTSPLQTREGIGARSTCEEVRAAYGAPASDGGSPQHALTYQLDGTTVYFWCRESPAGFLAIGDLAEQFTQATSAP